MKRLFGNRLAQAAFALISATVLLLSPAFTGAASAAESLSETIAAYETAAGKYFDETGFSSNRYAYTETDIKLLAIVIHMEARGEPYRCKLAIGNVVMNRVLCPGYPGKTVREVVTCPNQFCFKASVKPSADCVRAARDVLERQVWVVPQNTYFFKVYRNSSNWGTHTFYARIGHTAFYRDSRYAGRYNGSVIPQALYERVYRWPQYGCKAGARVRKLQAMLHTLGYDTAVDGYFGAGTKEALVRFQKAYGLAADGVAGPATLRKLLKKTG